LQTIDTALSRPFAAFLWLRSELIINILLQNKAGVCSTARGTNRRISGKKSERNMYESKSLEALL
jgi:hypothetical protein